MPRWVVVAVLLVLAGCNPAREFPAGTVRYDNPDNYARIQRVGQRIAIANAVLCKDTIGVMDTPDGAEACALNLEEMRSAEMGAYTDGTHIKLTPTMLLFVRTDDELAFIISHELAHILQGHVREAKVGAYTGAAIDGVLRGQGIPTDGAFQKLGRVVFNKDREREADRIGAYLMARAGYNPTAGAQLWDRMPRGNEGWFASHPPNQERRDSLFAVAAEISEKRQRSEILRP